MQDTEFVMEQIKALRSKLKLTKLRTLKQKADNLAPTNEALTLNVIPA